MKLQTNKLKYSRNWTKENKNNVNSNFNLKINHKSFI